MNIGEIQVAEYVRTDKGKIIKITSEKELEIAKFADAIMGQVAKHSPNLIDLIEEGDYVNGYRVTKKESTLICTSIKGIDGSGCQIPISQYGEGIKEILTHEQFNSMKYIVKGE